MTKRERVETASRMGRPDLVPFVPAVYEHKARLIGRSPSEVCRDASLLGEALRRELETYDPDVLTVGVDVYNVEAEALGCRVRYFDRTPDVPAVASPIVAGPGDLAGLSLPDPERDGRMPLMLRAAAQAAQEFGREMIVRGAVSGPFSMASALTGAEALLVATVEDAGFVRPLLELCGRVTVAFGRAFLARGAEVAVFDSKASPQAASPRVFREFVLPVYRDLVMPALKESGARHLPLIIGGDTTPILGDLLETGATQLLCDAGADLERFKAECGRAGRPFRVNVDARLVHRGTAAEVRAETMRILVRVKGQPGILVGCGVVAYDTDPANVLAIRDAVRAAAVV